MTRKLGIAVIVISCLSAIGCTEVFNITPYDTLPPNAPRDLTARNIQFWQESQDTGSITVAFTSDPHFYYGDLADVVSHINNDPSIDVVIIPGDLTDQGTAREFQWFTDQLEPLNKPWIATIGNHDHLSNGRQIYEDMFGSRNFLVDNSGYRFIFFDNTVWESEIPLDMAWLANALEGTGNSIPVVIMHIPPQNDQLADGLGAEMRELFATYEVPYIIHGHLHAFAEYTLPGSDTHYLCIPWPRDREYVRMTFDGGEVNIDRINL